VVFLEQLASLGGEFLCGGFGFGDGFAPSVSTESEAGRLAVALHGAARVSEVPGKERALAAHFFWRIGGPFDAGLEVASGLAVEEGTAFGGEAAFGVAG
jgi:hypothetical protein